MYSCHCSLDAEYFLGPAQCRDKWITFLETPSNELKDHSEEISTYLDQMQKSYTKDILTACATVVEASNVWKASAVLREWFQTVWLPLAKVMILLFDFFFQLTLS